MKILSFLFFLFVLSTGLSAETLVIDDPKDGWLNLRSGPGTSFRIIQRMDNGLRVEEMERQGNWSNVVLPNGAVGWSFRKYMRSVNSVAPQPPKTTADRWSYSDAEAGWNFTRNGELVARVFLGRDHETGRFYYGFYRVSDDPMIHFMGVSVAHSDGRISELEADGCYAKACMTEYEGGDGIASAQVRIPISPRDQAAILQEMKSGRDITFRYQSEASYAENSFKRMTLSLKGSRRAIERLEGTTLRRQPPAPEVEPRDTVQTSSPGIAVSDPKISPNDYANTHYVEDTQDGDRFCIAEELASFPPQFYSELPKGLQRSWQSDPTGNLKPAALDFVGIGTTVWGGFLSSSHQLVLYADGTARQIRDGGIISSNGQVLYGLEKWAEGNWRRDPAKGLIVRLRSTRTGESFGHRNVECRGGSMIANTAYGKRDGKNATWRSCSIAFYCKDWFDKLPDQAKEQLQTGDLTEWSRDQVIPEDLKWTRLNAQTR